MDLRVRSLKEMYHSQMNRIDANTGVVLRRVCSKSLAEETVCQGLLPRPDNTD
jgi:hypothetical protein